MCHPGTIRASSWPAPRCISTSSRCATAIWLRPRPCRATIPSMACCCGQGRGASPSRLTCARRCNPFPRRTVMNITESVDIAVTLTSALPGPAGVPLGTVPPGSRLLESQCTLALAGATGPFTAHLLLTPAPSGPDVLGAMTQPGPLPGTLLGIAPDVPAVGG